MAPLRTLHLTNAWHPSSGGVRTFYQALLDGANRERRRVVIVVPGDRWAVTDIGAHGRVYAVAAPPSPILDRRYRTILPREFLFGSGAIRGILEFERPDLIEVSDKYSLFHVAGLIKRRRGARPTVVGLSHERLDDAVRAYIGGSPLLAKLARWYLAAIYLRQFDAHVANSAYTAEELVAAATYAGPRRRRRWRLRDRIHTVPLGTDASAFGSQFRSERLRLDLIRRAGGARTSSLVVFAGRLSREKHAHWIVPTIELVRKTGRDVCLAVAGDGTLQAAMQHRAERSGTPAVWLGHVRDRRDLASLLASADLFLHPNPREPFGIGPLEAMASGTPVVIPRTGGVLSYADEKNSWLAVASPVGLAEAVTEALASPRVADARVRNALITAQQFDWRFVVSRVFETYDAIHAARLARMT